MAEPALQDGGPLAPGTDEQDPQGAPESEAPSLVQHTQGPWLDLPEGKVFRVIDDEVKRQEPSAKNRCEKIKFHRLQRDGVPWVQLEEKQQNRGYSRYECYVPPGVSALKLPSKVDQLSSGAVAQVTVDPPKPDAEPEGDSDKERSAAEFATRFLTADGSEAGTNDAEKAKAALDLAVTDMSSFRWVYVDRFASWRPEPIMAHPQAVSADAPLSPPQPAPQFDEMGQPVPVPPVAQETSDPIIRYVRPDGSLTDTPAEARRQWVPALCERTVEAQNVRLLPEMSKSLDDALGAVILWPTTVGHLTAEFPDVINGLSTEQMEKLLSWRPERPADHLPRAFQHMAERSERHKLDGNGVPDPDALVWTYVGYYKSCALYPDGASVVCNPAFVVRGKRTGVVDGQVVLRDIPLAQCRPMTDTTGGDWAGKAFVTLYASGDAMAQQVFGGLLEAMDKALHPLSYLSGTSPIQPQQIEDARATGAPLILASSEDKVQWEQAPAIPNGAFDLVDFIYTQMEQGARQGDTARGLESSNSVSGVAKRAAIEQSLVGLSSMFQNYRTAQQRVWRLKLQEAAVEFSVPQRVSYKGEDGSYAEQWWTGADFGGTKDVKIALGSGTMLSQSQKNEQVFTLRQFLPTVFSEDDAARMVHGNVSSDIGLKDNPHRMRILRDIKKWEAGPPEGWTPPAQTLDPMTGQSVMSAPSFTPFDPRPNDEDPTVARVQYVELVDFMSGTAYAKHPPEWRALLDQRLEQARYAAGVTTMRQQAEAQQQQAAQQQAQASAQMAQQSAEKDKDRAMKASDSEAARQQDASQFAAKQQAEAQSGAVSADLERTKIAAQQQMAALKQSTAPSTV